MVSMIVSCITMIQETLSAYIILWIVLILILICGAACLWSAELQVDFESTIPVIETVVLLLLLAWMFWSLNRTFSKFYTLQRLTLSLEDFFLSIAQWIALAAVSELLVYLAAKAGAKFPMRDDMLEYCDSLLGFEWHVAFYWINSYPAIEKFLMFFYNSLGAQIASTIIITSILYPTQRNIEFFTLFLLAISFTSLIFIYTPAVGMFGKLSIEIFDRLMDIRAGQSTMTYYDTAGIVSFPSFHTALAILIPYSVRYRYWSFVPALIVNIAMLIATSPEGGHYLVDILAGGVIAVVSILIVRCYLSYNEVQYVRADRTARFEASIKISGIFPLLLTSKRVLVRCLLHKTDSTDYRWLREHIWRRVPACLLVDLPERPASTRCIRCRKGVGPH